MTFSPSTPSSVLVQAVGWLQDTLLGSVATAVAVCAVGWFGLLMLTGRIEFKRAAMVVLGCFILFGASSIAHGIMMAAQIGGTAREIAAAPPPPPIYPTAPGGSSANRPRAYDPYAGAAVEVQQ